MKKLRKRPSHNQRKRDSFLARYGMSRSSWARWKKERRKAGEGHEIAKKRAKAIR